MRIKDVKLGWINTAGAIVNIADLCHAPRLVSSVLEGSWDIENVHFFVTAEEFEEDEDLAVAAERMDVVSELPLQTLNRSKHWVLTPYVHVAQHLLSSR